MNVAVNAAIIIFAMVSVAYVFAKVVEKAGFVKGILAASVTIDFYLFLLWVEGIDRPVLELCTKLGCATLTALELALPFKMLFTLYLITKQRQLRELLG